MEKLKIGYEMSTRWSDPPMMLMGIIPYGLAPGVGFPRFPPRDPSLAPHEATMRQAREPHAGMPWSHMCAHMWLPPYFLRSSPRTPVARYTAVGCIGVTGFR